MDEMNATGRTLNLFAGFSFSESYYALGQTERKGLQQAWLAGLRQAARRIDVYQVYPANANVDVMAWCAVPIEAGCDAGQFFEAFARATNPMRAYLKTVDTLWGFTRASQYSRARSAQEIDPFAEERKTYLVVYPFVKTTEWYLLGKEARQGVMNEHMRIGKQYTEIRQLLLYSFGVQDQEFVVVYETDDLAHFSDLVNELRSTDGRRYTLRDTPLYTAVYHPAEETLALWR